MMLAPLVLLFAAQPLAKMAVPAAPPAPTPTALSDEQILRNAHLTPDGPSLLAFFRRRAAPDVDPERLAELARQLGADKAAVQERAAAELVGIGSPAVPALRRALNHVDDEATSARARKCLEAIEGHNGAGVVQSAVRVLAEKNPAGSAAVLLDYLPFADDDGVVQEIESALLAVGLRDGKPDPVLSRALADPVPVRRSIAARVLCQVGGPAGRSSVRPLLRDDRPSVRMQAALALAEAHDAEALPVLTDLLADLPPEGRKQVEAFLAELAGEWGVRTPQGNDATSARLRRELWSAWWRNLDGDRLLDELRTRTPGDAERERVLGLIAKLDDSSPEVRAAASEELIGMGAKAAPLLRQAAAGSNPRRAAAARQCLETVERDSSGPLPEAALRLLALRRPEGAVEALLAYLPSAESEPLAEQVTGLLAVVGCPDGKVHPALVAALQDRDRSRRAGAAVALCKVGADKALPAVRKLLADPDAVVRMRTAVALVERGEKGAVPVLIASLADLPVEQVWEVEDLLAQLADDKVPAERAGADEGGRPAAVAAWQKWWRDNEQSADLARVAAGSCDRGLLLVVEMQAAGRVLELTRSGHVRWQIAGVPWPWDARVCPNGNVLVVDHSGSRISLRDRQGKELWTRGCINAFSCQRLRNGNVFVLGRNQVQEFDPNGKEVFSQVHNVGWIVGGQKFPDGQVAFVTQQGGYVRLDASGKQVKTFQIPFHWQNGVSGAEVLPGDRVVVSLGVGKVAEYADGGKLVWEASVTNPGFPHRLPNGHTLVPQAAQSGYVELNRAGKVVAEKKNLECRPFRLHRR